MRKYTYTIRRPEMEIPSELLDQDLIFHFTKARTAIENILFDGKLRFSSMSEMNDPYEYKIASPLVVICDKRIGEDIFNEATTLLMRTILKDSKVACFVKPSNEECDNFELPFIKPRSWAQYGEEQYGICLALSKSALLENITEEISEITTYKGSVTYDLDTYSSSKKASLNNYNQNMSVEENIYSHLATHYKDIFLKKYNDFADENEYRIILVDRSKNRRQYLFCPLKGPLKAIILGDRFHKVYNDLAKELCHTHSAIIYTLDFDSSQFIYKL